MAKIALLGGFYQARSIIANAQRCVNLYPEMNQKDSPDPVTHYPTPGLDLLAAGPISGAVRCSFRASNGDLYVCIGGNIYYVDSSFNESLLGTIANGTTPVSMEDNGLVVLIVDNSPSGYAIDMATRAFAQITDPTFVGATRVGYLDTYLLLNVIGTNRWYISLSEANFDMLTGVLGAILSGSIANPGLLYTNGTYNNQALTGGSGTGATANITVAGGLITTVVIHTEGVDYVVGDVLSAAIAGGSDFSYTVDSVGGYAFDPLDIAAKVGYPDPIATLIVMHREIWLIGQLTTEVWYNSGDADFTFQQLPGSFVEHGCVAPYSVAAQDLSIYWLTQDKQGSRLVVRGTGYQALRISTNAIENEFLTYTKVTDAIGFTYQEEGHVFYMLIFPSANKTWVYDQATELWHQRAWTDGDGTLNRHRANCSANAYGRNVVGDWENGNLYAFNLGTYTDNGDPISRIRSFPHIVEDGKRIFYNQFIADMEVGTDTELEDYNEIISTEDGDPITTEDGTPLETETLQRNANPPLTLRWSDTRGASWSSGIQQGMGSAGQYLTSIQFRRLGMARDRVFELSWSAPCKTALNGAWIQVGRAGT